MTDTFMTNYFNPNLIPIPNYNSNLNHPPNNNHTYIARFTFLNFILILHSPAALRKRLTLRFEGSSISLTASTLVTTTPFMVFSVTCVIVLLPPILRRMASYTNDQQLCLKCHLMTLGVRLLISWHGYVK